MAAIFLGLNELMSTINTAAPPLFCVTWRRASIDIDFKVSRALCTLRSELDVTRDPIKYYRSTNGYEIEHIHVLQ